MNDPFGRSRLPAHLSREGRVRLIGEAAQALVAGEQPSREAALFLGGALRAWLEHGGSLERDYLRVIANGSHLTPDRVWRRIAEEGAPLKGGPK